jgi:hypothetical protein
MGELTFGVFALYVRENIGYVVSAARQLCTQ